jgi:methylated-DNA-protein-cysteine methyltransferase-like protein
VVRSIPAGHVASYGEVGRALRTPASGYFVGRWMANCPADIPWWRVVAKDGSLPVWKRNPDFEVEQTAHLKSEGVAVIDGRVDMATYSVELERI